MSEILITIKERKEKKRKRGSADSINTTGMDQDAVYSSAPPNGAERHKIPPGEKHKKFQWGSGGWEAEPAHHQEYCSDICGGVFNVHLICMIWVADLIACSSRVQEGFLDDTCQIDQTLYVRNPGVESY